MKKARRLSQRAALAIALVIVEQERSEALANLGAFAPEEWAPMLYQGGEAVLVVREDAERAAARPLEDESMLFSHFSSVSDDGRRTYMRSFSSVRDFCEQPFACKENEELFNREENGGKFRDWGKTDLRDDPSMPTRQKTNESWYGAPSPEAAMHRAYRGWPEGAERVRSMMESMDAPPPVSLRRKVQRADQGDALDIHQVYRGGLDRAWERRRRLHSRARMSVRLVAQIGGSRFLEADQMFWRGAAVAKLAELLEESGYRVEIIGTEGHDVDGHGSEKEGATAMSSFVVKNAGAPIDLEQIAGVICNAGFYRTYGFRSAYALPGHRLRDTVREPAVQLVRGRLGIERRPVLDKDGRQKTILRTLLARSYTLGSEATKAFNLGDDGTPTFAVPMHCGSHDAAEEWVKKVLAKLDNDEGGDDAAGQ